MLAKELAELLLKNPNAIVGYPEYIGCDTPFLQVKKVVVVEKGKKSPVWDGGTYHDQKKGNIATQQIIILYTHKD
jgi:hypothetical protein